MPEVSNVQSTQAQQPHEASLEQHQALSQKVSRSQHKHLLDDRLPYRRQEVSIKDSLVGQKEVGKFDSKLCDINV
jgi:hypothetical protein